MHVSFGYELMFPTFAFQNMPSGHLAYESARRAINGGKPTLPVGKTQNLRSGIGPSPITPAPRGMYEAL